VNQVNIKGHSYYGPNLNHACIDLLVTIAYIYIYIHMIVMILMKLEFSKLVAVTHVQF